MAQLIRSAKSGSDWTDHELRAYNISIIPTSPAFFFQPSPDPSLDHIDPAILTSPVDAAYPDISVVASEYLGYLDFATSGEIESAVDFAAATLRLLGFNDQNSTVVATRYTIPLTICGENRAAQADVCLIHRPTTILLVLIEGNILKTSMEAQMVAEAIAVFQFNNTKDAPKTQPVLETMTIPCITMIGTNPTFYLVPVTKELSDAVMTGQYPPTQTRVLKCVTFTGSKRRHGMADIEFRKLALKHFVAFKSLAKSHWQQFLG